MTGSRSLIGDTRAGSLGHSTERPVKTAAFSTTPGTWDYELTEIDSGNPERPWRGPLEVYATWANDESVTVCTLADTPEQQGNARLISSAPWLLAECQSARRILQALFDSGMEWYDDMQGDHRSIEAAICSLEAAIEKATS